MKRIIHTFLVISLAAVLLSGCGNDNSDTIKETVSDISTETEAAEAVESNESSEESSKPESTEEAQQAEPVETAEAESTEVIEDVFVEESQTQDVIAEEQEAPAYTYTDLSKTMFAQQSVNIRDLPSTDGNKLGALALNQEVTVTGQCNETSWYRIEYSGSAAYVSNKYLGDSMVEVVQSNDNSSDLSTNTENPYPLFEVIDEGGDKVYFYWTWDGVTTQKSTEFWSCWNNCISILAERHGWEFYYDGPSHLGGNVHDFGPSDKTGYYVDGNYVMRARPQCCPNTTVPAEATEFAGWR